jgi:hypothetical protein
MARHRGDVTRVISFAVTRTAEVSAPARLPAATRDARAVVRGFAGGHHSSLVTACCRPVVTTIRPAGAGVVNASGRLIDDNQDPRRDHGHITVSVAVITAIGHPHSG